MFDVWHLPKGHPIWPVTLKEGAVQEQDEILVSVQRSGCAPGVVMSPAFSSDGNVDREKRDELLKKYKLGSFASKQEALDFAADLSVKNNWPVCKDSAFE